MTTADNTYIPTHIYTYNYIHNYPNTANFAKLPVPGYQQEDCRIRKKRKNACGVDYREWKNGEV